MFTPRNSKVVEKSFAFLSETKVWLTILDKFLNGTPIPSGVAGAAVELIRLVEVSLFTTTSYGFGLIFV